MAYFRCIGGNGGGAVAFPQILDFEQDITGNTRTSYTTKTYSLNAGDTLVIAVMHRADLTTPQGFSVVAVRGYSNAQRITILKYTAATAESKSVTVTQASSVRLSIYVWQMKNVSLSEATALFKSGASKTIVTLDNTFRPTLMVFSNVYSGAWGSANGAQIIFSPSSSNFTAYALNIGTAYAQTLSFTAGGNEWCTVGVYLTDE